MVGAAAIANAGPDQNVCGTTATLAANSPSPGTGTWSVTSGPSLSAAQFSSTSSQTPVFTAVGGAGIYILRWTITNSPCPASFDEVAISITPPIVNNNIVLQSACPNHPDSAMITISQGAAVVGGGNGTYNYVWEFSSPGASGPWIVVGGNTPTLNIVQGGSSQNGFYRRTIISGNCTSISNKVHVNITNILSAGTFSVTGGGAYCSGGAGVPVGLSGSSDSLTGIYATYQLFLNAVYTGISIQGNGSPLNFGIQTAAGVYTVQVISSVIGGSSCSAVQTTGSVTVTVNQPSVAATGLTAFPTTICNGGSSTLTQTGGTLGTGASWNWYSNNTYTTLVGTGAGAAGSLSVSPSVTTTYYLRIEGTTAPCTANVTGPAAGVTVTVNQPSVSPTVLNISVNPICEGNSTTLTQTGGSLGTGAGWKWYSDAAYTTLVGAGVGATASLSVSPIVTTTYYLRSEGGTAPCSANISGPASGVTVTVNKKSANPVSVSATPATICEGSSTTLALAGGGGGTGETISWYTGSCGGTLAGTGNNLVVSPATTTTYYGRYENSAPCNFNSSCLQVTVNVTVTGTWLGITTNWNNPANWCGGVPVASTNVNIPVIGSGFYPRIFSANAMAHDITLAAGSTLTVDNKTLHVSGVITNNGGIFDVGDGTLDLNGTGTAQNIAGSIFVGKAIENLHISNSSGVNLTGVNDTLKLSGVLKFGISNATLNTNNNLTLLSTANGTASVGDMTNNGANSNNYITGNVTVERYIPNHFKAWQFLAVPTSGQTVNATWQEGNTPLSNSNNPGYGTIITSNVPGAVSLGFDVYTPAGPTMKTYDSVSNNWIGIANPGIQIANQKGYMLFVRGDRSVTVFNQPATATVLRTRGKLYTSGADAPPVTNLNAGTFESIGNPYASAIDFNAVTKTGGVQDLFYVWDPKLTTSMYSAYGLGAYQTIIGPGPGYTVIPGGGSYSGSNTNIESGQAFFVHTVSNPGTVSFSETCKVDGSFMVTRPSNNQVKQLRTNLYVITAGNPVLLDGTLSQFDAAYSNTVDEMDAVKLNNSSENLSLLRDGKKLVAERRTEIQNTDTIFYNTGQVRVQQYRFEFIPSLIEQAGLLAFLEDNYLHISTVLSLHDTTNVMFNIINDPGSYAADRFRIVFNRPGPVPVTFTSVSANRNSDKTVTINWKVENETSIQLYTIERSAEGRNFNSIITTGPTANNGGSSSYSKIDLGALSADNFYRIKALSLGGRIQYSPVVKVAPLKSEPGINVYPNPVTGKIMQLQFIDQPAGKYNVVLIYSNGMQQQLSILQVNAGQATYPVEFPQLLASGIYQLRITGPDNMTTQKTIHVSAE